MAADVTPIAAGETRERLDRVTRKIIGSAQKVSSVLGCGFLEKVYENALCLELRRHGLAVEQQRPLHVRYETEIVGDYVTDILVENQIVVELKAVPALDRVHQMQCVHLRATGLRVCLLVNFGRPHLELRRIVNNF